MAVIVARAPPKLWPIQIIYADGSYAISLLTYKNILFYKERYDS